MAQCVPEEQENQMTTNNQNATNRRLQPGTLVVSRIDAEPGKVVRVCTNRRNGIDAWSYLIDTASGREIWEAGELFVPENA
jgi:hypothetical protein